MTTYLLRHARTTYSSRYLVNGDPSVPLLPDDEGVRACHSARAILPSGIRSWVVSTFPRTKQTACLLSNDPGLKPAVLPQLGELQYGAFEGRPFLEYANWLQEHGPWACPPSASESQCEGIRRMLLGVRAALEEYPSPRVIIAHGLLLSVLGWAASRAPGTPMPLFFPEAPYLSPLVHSDEHMTTHTETLMAEIDTRSRAWPPQAADARETGASGHPRPC